MTTTKIFIFFIVGLVLISCKRDKLDPSLNPGTYKTAIQLKVGNYWVYENKDIDIFNNSITYDVDDSIYIDKDTLINGKVYYKMGNVGGGRINFIFLPPPTPS